MNYSEAFEKLKKVLEKSKFEKGERHFAIQVCIKDPDASGIFYIEDVGDKILAEPYDYFDKDAEIVGQVSDLKKLFEKKIDFQKALNDGVITATGDISGLSEFFSRIKKASSARKPASAKSTKPKPAEKAKKSVTPRKKRGSESISDVVKKEVKKK